MDRKSTKHKGGDFCYLFLEHEDVFDIGNLSIIKIAKISKFSSYHQKWIATKSKLEFPNSIGASKHIVCKL